MRVTTDDGVELEVVVTGAATGPGLLLVHGFGGAKEDFADHVERLGAGRRVVTFDHRGHGASDAPSDPAAYSLDRLVLDLQCVARTLELQDLTVVGHSMGGMVAWRAVLDRPEWARALVLM